MKIESARSGKSWDEIDSNSVQVGVHWFLLFCVCVYLFSGRMFFFLGVTAAWWKTRNSFETWLLISFQDYDLLKGYVSKIQELEGELLCLKNLNNSKPKRILDCVESDDDGFHSKNILFPTINEYSSDYDTKAGDIPGILWKTLRISSDFLLCLVCLIWLYIIISSTAKLDFLSATFCYNYQSIIFGVIELWSASG